MVILIDSQTTVNGQFLLRYCYALISYPGTKHHCSDSTFHLRTLGIYVFLHTLDASLFFLIEILVFMQLAERQWLVRTPPELRFKSSLAHIEEGKSPVVLYPCYNQWNVQFTASLIEFMNALRSKEFLREGLKGFEVCKYNNSPIGDTELGGGTQLIFV